MTRHSSGRLSRREFLAGAGLGVAGLGVLGSSGCRLILDLDDWDESEAPGSARATPTPSTATSPDHPDTETVLAASTGSSGAAQLQRVGLVSLEPANGSSALELTGSQQSILGYQFSPGAHFLAVLAHPEEGLGIGLYLVDVNEWSVQRIADVEFSNRLPRFTPDGNEVVWVRPDVRPDETDGQTTPLVRPLRFLLVSYSRGTGEEQTISLPERYTPTELSPLASGDRVAIVATVITPDGFDTGELRMLIVETRSGSIETDLRLEGVTGGGLQTPNAGDDRYPVHLVRPGLTFDHQQGLLYIGHAADEQLTVVDLGSGEIRDQIDWEHRNSIGSRILDWFGTPAQALARARSDGHAVLSPDGNYLYVARASEELSLDRERSEEVTASEVAIIDVSTLELAGRHDLGVVREIVPGPNGTRALVHTFPHLLPAGDQGDGMDGHALYLLNAAGNEVERQLELTGQPLNPIEHDGERVYLKLRQSEDTEWLVIDPATLEILAQHTNPDIGEVLVP